MSALGINRIIIAVSTANRCLLLLLKIISKDYL